MKEVSNGKGNKENVKEQPDKFDYINPLKIP